jgi:hypothetical protein
MDDHHVTIKMEPYNDRLSKFIPKTEEWEDEEPHEEMEKTELVQIYESIMRHFQSYKEKMVFYLFFQC